jgi:hypothetical protein
MDTVYLENGGSIVAWTVPEGGFAVKNVGRRLRRLIFKIDLFIRNYVGPSENLRRSSSKCC